MFKYVNEVECAIKDVGGKYRENVCGKRRPHFSFLDIRGCLKETCLLASGALTPRLCQCAASATGSDQSSVT